MVIRHTRPVDVVLPILLRAPLHIVIRLELGHHLEEVLRGSRMLKRAGNHAALNCLATIEARRRVFAHFAA